MAQTVNLTFRDGTTESFEESTMNVVGDFLIVETPTEDGGIADFYPAGSLRKAQLVVTIEEEDEGAELIVPDFPDGSEVS